MPGPSVIVDGALVAARHLQVGLLLVGAANAIEVELSRHPAARGSSTLEVDRRTRASRDGGVGRDRATAKAARLDSGGGRSRARRPRARALQRRPHRRVGDGGACAPSACCRASIVPRSPRSSPRARSPAVLLDSGATVGCRPPHLVQFAVMGSAYARVALGLETPRVGLLSVGEEENKGNDLTREAHQLLKEAPVTLHRQRRGTRRLRR